jgi:putative DNA primase/helicase
VTTAQQPDVLSAALAFHDAGCSVIPVAVDGSKRPAGQWKTYQQTRASRDQVKQWFATGHPGVGVVTGAVSGNLVMLELEGRAVTEGLLAEVGEIALASGLAELWNRITRGYAEATPSGGVHFLVRSLDPVEGNLKLARRPGPAGTVEVLAETRGEGGFVVVAPSHGPVHPTGKAWQRALGDPASIPDLTGDELHAVYTLLRCLDRMPEPPASVPAGKPDTAQPVSDTDAFLRPATAAGGVSPGDDWNARASWEQILTPHGWTVVHRRGQETYWRRPGKHDGISATTGYGDGDWLYVFSTSTELPTEQTLTKFAAYAHLEHRGDFSTAASTLRAKGYGTPPPEQPRPAQTTGGGVNAATASAKDTPKAAPLPAAGAPAPPPDPTTYSRTDDGNALRLVDQHRHQLRYVPQRGQWLAWDGHRWRWDDHGQVHEHTRTLARDLPNTAKEEQRHRAWSLSARGLTACIKTAQTDPRVVTSVANLDRRPYELNTPAGVVDLRTATLRAPDPAALHTRSTDVAPDLDNQPDRWLRFLADTFAGDPALTLYIQRLLGVSLIGTVLEQLLPFGFGEGANGKTTLLGAVMRVIGLGDDGYALTAPAELLLATQNSGHPTELARLAGARLVVTSELEEGQRFAEAKVKQLTGRDPVTARFMRQDFFTFTPTHSLWLLANHAPAVRAGGPAFWRRLRLLPFLHVVPADQRDPHLEDRLVEDEGPQILGWLIRGAAEYLAHGLAEPASVRTATSSYERDQDTVGRFVDETCQLGPIGQQGMRVKVAELRAAYETWCRIEGETPVNAKGFTLALCSRFGVQRDRDMTARWYDGIRLDASSDVSSEEPRDEKNGW